jgi:hypothetical protein
LHICRLKEILSALVIPVVLLAVFKRLNTGAGTVDVTVGVAVADGQKLFSTTVETIVGEPRYIRFASLSQVRQLATGLSEYKE